MGTDYRCRIRNVSKSFPGVKALRDVSFDVFPGEIHAVVGENGAGKSTLMNVLSGVFRPDAGTIEIDGAEREFANPREACESGVAMIHQELSLFSSLRVYENVFIGRMPRNKLGLIDRHEMIKETYRLLETLGVEDLNPNDEVRSLSVSRMQFIEIAKAVSQNARMLIMDEPTSSLTAGEITQVIEVMKRLRGKGVSILFITHKLQEVFEVADRITVLRDGALIDTLPANATDIPAVVSLMVGRLMEKRSNRMFISNYSQRNVVLEVDNFSVPGKVFEASLKLYEGEVLGLTGLVGSGRTELVQGLFGSYKNISGEITVCGKRIKIRKPTDAIDVRIGLVPEGRKEQGMFLELSVGENISMVMRRRLVNRIGLIKRRFVNHGIKKMVDRLAIKVRDGNQISRSLSGGNQQKSVIARWLLNEPHILFMDEPTHGIDVGAKAEIYKLLDQLVSEGLSVILISSELPEVIGLCDRIAVMHKGRIVRTFHHWEASEQAIMQSAFNQTLN